MSVPAWKWLLTALDDELLIAIAKALKVRVAGFRGGNWDKSIKLLRPRIVQSMLVPEKLLLLGDVADSELQEDQSTLAIRNLTGQQLLEQVPSQVTPIQALLALLSSPETTLVERGQSLYQHWESSGLLTEWQQACGQAIEIAKGPDNEKETELIHYRQQITELEAQLRKRDKKLQKLAADLAKQKSSLTRAQRRWQQERKQLANQLMARETALKQCETQLFEQATTSLKQPQVIDQLRELVPASKATAELDGTCLSEQLVEKVQMSRAVQTIAVIGNLQQVNLPPEQHAGFKLLHIAPIDLQNGQAQETLVTADQVWLLTYATPLPLQRRLRQLVPAAKLACFATYQDYMHNLGQGV